MHIAIKRLFTAKLLFEIEADSLKIGLEIAVKSKANLEGANLRGANIQPIRDDIWAVLSSQPNEVQFLRAAIAAGKIDGSAYRGECACLVGTLANACSRDVTGLEFLKPNLSRPAERFFLAIKRGDTPENSQFSELALEWVDQWLSNVASAFAVRK